jgi:hypothetical protein
MTVHGSCPLAKGGLEGGSRVPARLPPHLRLRASLNAGPVKIIMRDRFTDRHTAKCHTADCSDSFTLLLGLVGRDFLCHIGIGRTDGCGGELA